MSRQMKRHADRMAIKAKKSADKIAARKVAKRDLLERQSARDKSDYYTGRSVAAAISPSRSRISDRKVKKGTAFCRIILTKIVAGCEISLHATKGWRSHRAA